MVFCHVLEEMPARLLVPKLWTLVRHGRCLYDDHIVKLVAICINKAISHLSRDPAAAGARVLILCDSMSVVLAFARCRARSFSLVCEVRRAAAACLALGIRLHIRWVPPNLNSADEGKRFEDLGVAASKHLLEQLEILQSAQAHAPVAHVCSHERTSPEDGLKSSHPPLDLFQ